MSPMLSIAMAYLSRKCWHLSDICLPLFKPLLKACSSYHVTCHVVCLNIYWCLAFLLLPYFLAFTPGLCMSFMFLHNCLIFGGTQQNGAPVYLTFLFFVFNRALKNMHSMFHILSLQNIIPMRTLIMCSVCFIASASLSLEHGKQSMNNC